MGKIIPVFTGATGLNNKIDPTRLAIDKDAGTQELATAVNVDIDDSGRVSRRNGYAVTSITSDCHSLFCGDSYGLFVSGSVLYRIESGNTATSIGTVSAGLRMDYCQVNDRVYYVNGIDKGYVDSKGVVCSWTGEDYVGPTTTKTFVDPPYGTLITHYAGRIFIASGNVVWYSQPFAHAWFDFTRNFMPFSYDITMLKAVDDGLYVGTKKNTYFVSGKTPDEFSPKIVSNYSVIKGTAVVVPTEDLNFDAFGNAVMWTTREGICIGLSGGQFKNLTKKKLVLPAAFEGAALYFKGKYICTLEP